jgi:hypothetical protein
MLDSSVSKIRVRARRFVNLTRRQAKWLAVGFYAWVLVAAFGGLLGYRWIRPDLIGVGVGLMLTGTVLLVLGLPIAVVGQIVHERRQR